MLCFWCFFFSSRSRHTICALVTGVQTCALPICEDTLEGFQDAFSARIQALAATHNLLAETSWVDLVLRDLAVGELAPFVSPGSNRIHLENLNIRVTARAAVAVGLVLHELVTNAVKYGALSTESGKLWLSAKYDPEQKFLRLEWVEAGGPPVSEPERH